MKKNLLIVTLMPVLLYGQAAINDAQQMVQAIDALHTELIDTGYGAPSWCSTYGHQNPRDFIQGLYARRGGISIGNTHPEILDKGVPDFILNQVDAVILSMKAWADKSLFGYQAPDKSYPYIRAVLLAGLISELSDLKEAVDWANGYHKALAITGGTSGRSLNGYDEYQNAVSIASFRRGGLVADAAIKINDIDGQLNDKGFIFLVGLKVPEAINKRNGLINQKKQVLDDRDNQLQDIDTQLMGILQRATCGNTIRAVKKISINPNPKYAKQIKVSDFLNKATADVAKEIIDRDELLEYLGASFKNQMDQEFKWLESFTTRKFPSESPSETRTESVMKTPLMVPTKVARDGVPVTTQQEVHQGVQAKVAAMKKLAGIG